MGGVGTYGEGHGSDRFEIGRRQYGDGRDEEEEGEEEEEEERHHHHHYSFEHEEELDEEELDEEELDSDDRGGDDVTVPQESYSTRSQLNISKDESPLEKDNNFLNGRCRACSRLNLPREKFIIHGKHAGQTAPYTFDRTGLKLVELGYPDDIYSRRRECPFCRLVYKSTHKRDGGWIGHDGLRRNGGRILCNLDWQLDGRNGNLTTMTLNQDHGRQKHSKALTRRARLHSKKGAFPDAFVVLLRNLCLETRSPTFLGRAVGKQYINLDLLRGWIDTCVSCHGLACETLHDAELASNSLYVDGMRFIDVIKMRLATAWVKSIKYVALSYVWGSAEMARTVMVMLSRENTSQLHSTEDLPYI
ncbi:hypothetical protein ACEPPN_000636 [Leptodophora sp. 'Broadleaf-Isolate-01']